MIRQFALAALIATGTVGGLSATAFAQPPTAFDRHDHDRDHDRGRYQVLVRHRGHWDVHATYRNLADAYRAARRLERQGFGARVERVRGW